MNDLFGTLTKLILKPLNNLLLIISIFLCNSLAFCQISVNYSAPYDDFINDFLEVRGVNIIDFEFSIYSRWSEQIFYTKDINHYWDGTFKGRLVPTGTYTYTISAYGKDAKMLRLNGHVNVIH